MMIDGEGERYNGNTSRGREGGRDAVTVVDTKRHLVIGR